MNEDRGTTPPREADLEPNTKGDETAVIPEQADPTDMTPEPLNFRDLPGQTVAIVSVLSSPSEAWRQTTEESEAGFYVDLEEYGQSSWHLCPLEQNRKNWWIGNYSSGMFLTKCADEAYLHNAPYEQGQDIPKWRLEPDADPRYFYIKDMDTYKYVTLAYYEGPPEGDWLNLTEDKTDWCRWMAVPTGRYTSPAVKNLRYADPYPDYGSVPDLTSMSPPRDHTDLKLIGEVALPAAVVKDGDHDLAWKLKHSAYYILRRYSQWRMTSFKTYPPRLETEHTVEYTWGVSQSASQAIKEDLNIAVTAEAGFSMWGVSASISTTVGYGLGIETVTGRAESYSKTETFRTTYEASETSYAVADWERLDVYSLVRAGDGEAEPDDEILRWNVVVPNLKITNSYQAPEILSASRV